MRQAKCLLIFDEKDLQSLDVRDVAVDVLSENGIEPVFLDSGTPETRGAAVSEQISDQLRATDFVIGEISMNNSNILFELGIAHGLGKPIVVLLSEKKAAGIPSDLMGFQFITYNVADFSVFRNRLNRVTASVASRLEREK